MKRIWGVLWASFGLWGVLSADSSIQPLRAPNGMLWAGTTFELRATAQIGNQLAGVSNISQTRVGQVIHWQWSVESPVGQSVVSGVNSEAVFQVRVTNDGNGWDRLFLAIDQFETVEQSAWSVELRENAVGGWQNSSPLANGAGSLIAPGDAMFYLVRMRPPSSSIPTDGVWSRLTATTSDGGIAQILGEFVAGAVRSASVSARAWAWSQHTQFVAPILYQGRLFWMGTDPNTNNTVVFYTRDAVEATSGGTLGNERLTGRTLRNFRPMGFSVVLGSSWFVGQDNQLVRIDLAQAQLASATTPVVFPVQFPSGVAPRLDIEPIVYNGRLYVLGSDRRLYAFREDGMRLGQSAVIPANYGVPVTNLIQLGRMVYVGTREGWLVQIDALTGSIRTARRITTQPLHSLALPSFGRVMLARVGNREVLSLNPNQLSVLWRRTVDEDIVSPISAATHQELGAFLTKSGQLHVFHARAGVNLGHYPQRIFGERDLSRAIIGVTRRADRPASYLYVLAQVDTGSESQSQALFRAVTLQNPYNRLEFGESTMHVGSDYLPFMHFTGIQSSSYCLIASRRAESAGGTVAAIPLR
ncbi:MAG: hypothetical protein KatS3mg019_1256 [Fimbriimonadales bacterium]|nr:MAG: hypothetical protein KatS3mg019_1256 [Fimbriimonadales bacterium]